MKLTPTFLSRVYMLQTSFADRKRQYGESALRLVALQHEEERLRMKFGAAMLSSEGLGDVIAELQENMLELASVLDQHAEHTRAMAELCRQWADTAGQLRT